MVRDRWMLVGAVLGLASMLWLAPNFWGLAGYVVFITILNTIKEL